MVSRVGPPIAPVVPLNDGASQASAREAQGRQTGGAANSEAAASLTTREGQRDMARRLLERKSAEHALAAVTRVEEVDREAGSQGQRRQRGRREENTPPEIDEDLVNALG